MPGSFPETLVELLQCRAEESDQPGQYLFVRSDDTEESLTCRHLHRSAQSVAAALTGQGLGRKAVLLLFPPGLDFLRALFGCFYAGSLAVPAYPPAVGRVQRSLPRLRAIAGDSGVAAVITVESFLPLREKMAADAPELSSLPWLSVERLCEKPADGFAPSGIDPKSLAFLQYTSGSTGVPRGVMLTHGNALHNQRQIQKAFDHDRSVRVLSWLPVYHDMGLIGSVFQPLYLGAPCVMTAPMEFVQNPVRWLQLISRYRATTSGGPNFAYDLCARRVSDDDKAGLDLRSWRVAFNGAEPVRSDTLRRFAAAFEPCGFSPAAFLPCYGLAEGTLIVSGGPAHRGPEEAFFDRGELEKGRATDAGENSPAGLASSGEILADQRVHIVEPESRRVLESGHIGEIWVQSSSVADGYFGNEAATEETFRATLETGEGPFLRTGDLGFVRDNSLFVTGRLKDLIILQGRNLYPQDIERCVEDAHPGIHPGGVAAFTVDNGSQEELAVVAEVRRTHKDVAALETAVLRAVAEAFEIRVHHLAFIQQGTMLKTSSGKVRRSACRAALRDGSLRRMDSGAVRDPELDDKKDKEAKTSTRIVGVGSLTEYLRGQLSERLGIPSERIDLDRPFAEYGLSSLEGVNLVGELGRRLGRTLPPSLLYDYPTPVSLAAFLDGGVPLAAAASMQARGLDEPIAVIGIGCRLPGADSPEEFWRLLVERRDMVREVPENRWRWQDVYSADPAVPGKTVSRWGAFVNGIDAFDPEFFGVSPKEARSMDPQQRILLQTAYRAIEDAGLPLEKLKGSSTGVFVGLGGSEYSWFCFSDPARASSYTATGSFGAIAANRLSYLWDLRGPSFTVDAVCSSSLVALDLACKSLRDRECSLAIVGGSNLLLTPDTNIWFSKLGVLAPEGRCRAFSDDAEGIVLGEGAAAIVLKPYGQAIADGDRIYALIRGSATMQDGRSNGMTAPSGPSQEALLREAYRRAAVDPASVQFVETHGTGTILGDPLEARALGAVLGGGRIPSRPLYLGSVKTNIGHLGMVGGLAGFIKSVLALHHRQLPSNLNFRRGNPEIAFSELGLKVCEELTPLAAGDSPLRAGVTSLSFGGTNAHVVLEAVPASSPSASEDVGGPLLISAHTESGLRVLAAEFRRGLQEDGVALPDFIFSAASRRSHGRRRMAVFAESRVELIETLAGAGRGGNPKVLVGGSRSRNRAPVFVFCGAGGKHDLVGNGLWSVSDPFREVLEEIDSFLTETPRNAMRQIFAEGHADLLREAALIPIATFALQAGLFAILRSAGVRPGAVLGHSAGEVAAAYASGALSLADAVRIVEVRSTCQQRHGRRGAMIAASISWSEAREHVERGGEGLSVAAWNSPSSVTFSGDRSSIERLEMALSTSNSFFRRLDVEVCAHSSGMDPLERPLAEAFGGLAPKAVEFPFYSTVTGTPLDGPSLDGGYWWRNVRQPVRFSETIAAVAADGFETFIELGPGPVLVHALRECLGAGPQVLGAIRPGSGMTAIMEVLAGLHVEGRSVDWGRVLNGRCVSLPPVPWENASYWLEGQKPGVRPSPMQRDSESGLASLLLEALPYEGSRRWRIRTSPQGPLTFLNDHRLGDAPVFPAAGFCEALLEAAQEAFGLGAHAIEALSLDRLYALADDQTRPLVMEMDERNSVRMFSSRDAESGRVLHAGGRLRPHAPGRSARTVRLGDLMQRLPVKVDPARFYGSVGKAGGGYGPAFQTLRTLRHSEDASECLAEIDVAGTDPIDGFILHPRLIDAGLQAALSLELGAGMEPMVPIVPRFMKRVLAVAGVGPDERLFCHARRRSAAGSELRADVTLFGEDGVIFLEIEGVQFTALSSTSIADSLYRVAWAPDELEGLAVALPGTWLVVGGADSPAANLVRVLEGQGGRCVMVRPEAEFKHVGEREFELRTWEKADWGHLLNALPPAERRFDGVVHVVAADVRGTSAPGALTPEDLKLHEWSVTAMVSSLETAAGALWMVTRAVHAPTGAVGLDDVNPVGAGLWGLSRVLAHERPGLLVTAIDLGAPREDDVFRIVQEMARSLDRRRNSRDRQVVLRDLRYTGQLSRLAPAISTMGTDPERGELVIDSEAVDPGLGIVFGRVVSASSDVEASVGARVVTLRSEAEGALCARLVVDADSVVPISGAPNFAAAALSFGPYAVAFRLLNEIRTVPGTTAFIQGADSKIGRALNFMLEREGLAVIAGRAGSSMRETFNQAMRVTGGTGANLVFWLAEDKSSTRDRASLLADGGTLVEVVETVDTADNRREGRGFRRNGLYRPVVLRETVAALFNRSSDVRRILDEIASGALPSLSEGSSLAGTRQAERTKVEETKNVSSIRADGAYLVVGGSGGIGLTLSEWLVRAGAGTVWIAGRREPSAAAALQIAALRAPGADIQFVAADVSRREEVARLIARISAGRVPLRGIFHCAGAIDDDLVQRLTYERFVSVFAAKVWGAWYLHELSSGLDLDLFVMCSSASAILGFAGQANYASANAFLDSLAVYRRARGLPAHSVNWGPWSDVGGAARMGVLDGLERQGLRGVSPKDGIRALEWILRQEEPVVAVMPVEWTRYAAFRSGLAGAPLLGDLARSAVGVAEGAVSRADLLRSPAAERRLIVRDLCRERASEVLGCDPARFEMGSGLVDAGLTSLGAMQIVGWAWSQFGAQISPATLLAGASANDVAAEIERQFETPEGITPSVIVPIQEGNGTRPALFCFHGAGGQVVLYRSVATALGREWPVYGVQSRAVAGATPEFSSIDEMAREYARAIRAVQPRGPYYFLGWSLGAMLASMVTAAIEKSGETVAFLGLWDPPPSSHVLNDDEFAAETAIAAGHFTDLDQQALRTLIDTRRSELAVLSPGPRLRRLVEMMGGHGPLAVGDDAIANQTSIIRAHMMLVAQFEVPSVRAPRYFWWPEEQLWPSAREMWDSGMGAGAHVFVTSGNHFTMVREPHVSALAGAFRTVLLQVAENRLSTVAYTPSGPREMP